MRSIRKTRLLWVEDQISRLPRWVGALEKKGFAVTTACSYDEGMTHVKAEKFDVILADLRMPPPNGVEFLRDAHQEKPKACYAALSTYLYLPEYRDALRRLGFPVQLIEKQAVESDSQDFEELYVKPLQNLAVKGVVDTVDTQDKSMREPYQVDPFQIQLEEFMRLPLLRKDQLVDAAEKMARRTLEKAFAEGKVWVLFCGDKRSYRASASFRDEILNDEEIMAMARAQGVPAYHFFRPKDNVEDIQDWSECGKTEGLDYYPTVTLNIKEEKLVLHFDTGSPITFFSYEELVRLGAVSPTHNFAKSSRLGREYRCIDLNIDAILESQDGGQSLVVQLRGESVRDWGSSPYARKCSEKCDRYPDDLERRICPQRAALVGRNLLLNGNGVRIVLDGINKQTRLE